MTSRPRWTRRLQLLLALSSLAAPGFAQSGKFPEPEPGQATNAVIALIRFERDACEDAVRRLTEFWQSSTANEEGLSNFMLENLGPDLASARASADVIDFLLPRTRAESGAEAQAAMGRLAGSADAICDEVAEPRGPLSAFQERLGRIRDSMALDESELGRLVVLPDAKGMDAAIEPFLEPIQLESLKAEAEYLAFLRANRPKEVKVTLTERMAAWHQQSYSPKVVPVKALLGRYLEARGKNDGKGMSAVCKELNVAMIAMMRETAFFKAPDPKVEAIVKRPYIDIRNLATECAAGRYPAADTHYQAMQQHLQEAAQLLGRYGLRP